MVRHEAIDKAIQNALAGDKYRYQNKPVTPTEQDVCVRFATLSLAWSAIATLLPEEQHQQTLDDDDPQ